MQDEDYQQMIYEERKREYESRIERKHDLHMAVFV
jgi:hypothetical protein